MSNSLDPDQARSLVGADLFQTVCKIYQQTTLKGNELKKRKYFDIQIEWFDVGISYLKEDNTFVHAYNWQLSC